MIFKANTPSIIAAAKRIYSTSTTSLVRFIRRVAKLPLNSRARQGWHYSMLVDIQDNRSEAPRMPVDEFLEKRIFTTG